MSCPPLYVVVQGADSRRGGNKEKDNVPKEGFRRLFCPSCPSLEAGGASGISLCDED